METRLEENRAGGPEKPGVRSGGRKAEPHTTVWGLPAASGQLSGRLSCLRRFHQFPSVHPEASPRPFSKGCMLTKMLLLLWRLSSNALPLGEGGRPKAGDGSASKRWNLQSRQRN